MSAYETSVPKVTMAEAIKSFFKNYVNFHGRARRSEFWMMFLFNFLVSFAIASCVPAIAGIYSLAVFIPNIALGVRRFHDVGRSGWWYLLIFVPFGGIVLLVWCCTDSKDDNKWGPNPKKPASAGYYGDFNQPVQPILPVQPIQPIQPIQPVQPVQPVQPIQPVHQESATVYEPQTPQLPDPQPAGGVTLYLYAGPMAGTSFKIPAGSTKTLGRNPSRSDLLLNQYEVVSGCHCQISAFSDYITVTDLNSTNGTYVNGTRLTPNKPVSVRNGATIYLANSSCAFQVRFQ